MKRLLLFDIDGTLVWGGPAKKAFELAMELVFGTAGSIDGHDFSGKTDCQIARELLRAEGVGDGEIDAGFQRLWQEYLGELEPRLAEMPMTVLPGVRSLLEHLNEIDGVAMGLLTGNIADGARLKLDSVGLMDYFLVGGTSQLPLLWWWETHPGTWPVGNMVGHGPWRWPRGASMRRGWRSRVRIGFWKTSVTWPKLYKPFSSEGPTE